MAELPDRGQGPRGAYLTRRKLRIREAQEWADKATLGNPKYRFRLWNGLQDGTLNPMIEKTILELAYGKAQTTADILKALGNDGVGLINLLLRKALTVDPLTEAKPIGAGSTEAIEATAEPIEPRPSIVPPSRPKKPKGTGPPLGPGEEIMR